MELFSIKIRCTFQLVSTDSNYYPYRMNNNAGNETGKWNMAAGDIREFLLVWDGSSGYYAYLLNIRE